MERRGQGRKTMEERYGEVESGANSIEVRGVRHRLREVLARWMMDVPEILTLDGGTLGEGRHWIRFIDKDDRTYVVFEFNGEFDILSEIQEVHRDGPDERGRERRLRPLVELPPPHLRPGKNSRRLLQAPQQDRARGRSGSS